jgi:hypothetical protein
MIAREQMMPLLLAACPSFASEWAEYCASVVYDPELNYLHLAELARHLIELEMSAQRAEFESLFAVVERLHTDGDGYVRAAGTIGFLEALQNNARHASIDPERFVPYLLPETRAWWDELNRFWAGESAYVGEKRKL